MIRWFYAILAIGLMSACETTQSVGILDAGPDPRCGSLSQSAITVPCKDGSTPSWNCGYAAGKWQWLQVCVESTVTGHRTGTDNLCGAHPKLFSPCPFGRQTRWNCTYVAGEWKWLQLCIKPDSGINGGSGAGD